MELRNEVGRGKASLTLQESSVGRFASIVSWRTAANVARQASMASQNPDEVDGHTASWKLAAFDGCGSIRVAPMVPD